MKAKQFIKKLNKLIEKHGDLELIRWVQDDIEIVHEIEYTKTTDIYSQPFDIYKNERLNIKDYFEIE